MFLGAVLPTYQPPDCSCSHNSPHNPPQTVLPASHRLKLCSHHHPPPRFVLWQILLTAELCSLNTVPLQGAVPHTNLSPPSLLTSRLPLQPSLSGTVTPKGVIPPLSILQSCAFHTFRSPPTPPRHEPLSWPSGTLITGALGVEPTPHPRGPAALGPSSPRCRAAAPRPPHWHASGTHRWDQSPLLEPEPSCTAGSWEPLSPQPCGCREPGAERAHFGAQSLLLTAAGRHSCR